MEERWSRIDLLKSLKKRDLEREVSERLMGLLVVLLESMLARKGLQLEHERG